MKSLYSKDRQIFAPFWCTVRIPVKVIDLKIEMNSKYSFTDRKEHQFYTRPLENMNAIKVGN
jgi:hypothetical protein